MNRDTILWAVAAMAVLGNAVVGIFNIERMLQRDHAVTARLSALAEIADTLSDMKDAETGHRGYVITNNPAYLQPYESADARVPERLRRLRGLLADQPDQLRELDEVERVAGAKFAEMKRTLALRDEQGLGPAAAEISRDTGKELMDRLRGRVGGLQREQERLLAVDHGKATEQRWTALMTLILGAVLAVAIILTAAAVVRLELARRLAAFTALQTAKADAETALNRLDAFIRNAPCGIAYYDADLRYIRINDAFAELNGRPAEAHAGKTIEEVRPDFPAELRQEYLEVSRTQVPAISRRMPLDGGVWEISVFPVKATRAERPGLGIIGIDVTEKAVAEARVVESEARFRTVAEAMPQIVWMTRPDGSVEYFNLRWYEFTGLTAERSLAGTGAASSTRTTCRAASPAGRRRSTTASPTRSSTASAGPTGSTAGSSPAATRCGTTRGRSSAGSEPAPTSTTASARPSTSRASSRTAPWRCGAATRSWRSSPTSRRTTCRSRCARFRPSATG